MRLNYHLSGSTLFSVEADFVPPVGSRVMITTEGYKKGLLSGSLIEFTVGEIDPIHIDYDDGVATVSISVDGYEVLKEGPPID
ncbi:MAG: hypothetical protein WBA51_19955 [Erythrobacter sp.]